MLHPCILETWCTCVTRSQGHLQAATAKNEADCWPFPLCQEVPFSCLLLKKATDVVSAPAAWRGAMTITPEQRESRKVVSLVICIFTRGSCWLLPGASQNDPPSPPPATPTMVCPSPKSTCTPLRKPTSLPETRSAYSGFLFLEALAPQSCVTIITVPFFFLLSPQTGNFCSSLWNTTSGILELIFRCVEAFQTKIDA